MGRDDDAAAGGRVVVSTHADITMENATVLDLADFTLRPEQVFAGIVGEDAFEQEAAS